MKRKGWMAILAGVTALSVTGCSMTESFLFDAGRYLEMVRAGGEKAGPLETEVQSGSEWKMASSADVMMEDTAAECYEFGTYEEPWNSVTWNTEEYDYNPENGWMAAVSTPLSTFAADVDTASYANIRRMILRGDYLPVDAVRVEEMINYFHYDYPQPQEGEPFSVTTQIAPCPWNQDTQLLLIGMNTKEISPEEHAPSNLVFLIDVSGSMDEADKLPLVQRAFKMLTENLRPEDTISIVTYASSDEVVLEGVTGEEPQKIRSAIEDLMAGGGTNGSDGIITAYELAEKYFIEGGNNRVILATDGDLNIGITDEGSLTRLVQEKAASGIDLSVLGFGTGNLSDARMEAMADNGNGNYSYIDTISEARKVLVEEMGGTLFTVAKDVKLQVEFNPARIKGYRQIGYENRQMAAEEFADDSKDGGEIGAGHQVTVLYEIAPVGSAQEINEPELRYGSGSGEGEDVLGELLNVNIRYKEPAEDTSKLLSYPVTDEAVCEEMSDDLCWAAAVAEFGMILKESEYRNGITTQDVRGLAKDLAGDDPVREEFLYLVSRFDPAEYDAQ